ncbi:acetyltransferase [Sulfitobacter sp. F26204]|uniref:acetyltransferase n=1 Tax=Sulfitobacter sp. F26204 TaxID=2996014 RepID=UPI00225DEB15|nr:acetyltransferase [Sulfitobacter sp. F26204]MCX7559702.1 acetyltransferase [Sulfitobacter sp. F26204]
MLIGVYGASGCGRGIMPLLRAQHPRTELVFIDDGQAPSYVNGHDVIPWAEFLKRQSGEKAVSIAIAASKTRQTLAEKCSVAKVPLVEARAASVVQMDEVVIEEGACLSPFVTLTSNIRIGRCFHANLYSYVEHDCIIGDFVTFAPGVKCNGNVTIGDHAYIGSGAIIRQGINIGAGAIVGMGAVVTRDVAPGVTIVGNPAKPLIKD